MRTDRASRVIEAPPGAIYHAFVDAGALAGWLPPEGMTGEILVFEPRAGGRFRIALHYAEPGHATPGKTSVDTDVVEGRFVELVEDRRIVWAVEFESDDPAFAGRMTMTWAFEAAARGTEVSLVCENVPDGIRKEDHDAGLRSSLDNLARFVTA